MAWIESVRLAMPKVGLWKAVVIMSTTPMSRSIKAKPTALPLNMLPHTSLSQDTSMTVSALTVAPFAFPTRLSKSTLTALPLTPGSPSIATLERSSNR